MSLRLEPTIPTAIAWAFLERSFVTKPVQELRIIVLDDAKAAPSLAATGPALLLYAKPAGKGPRLIDELARQRQCLNCAPKRCAMDSPWDQSDRFSRLVSLAALTGSSFRV